MTTRAGRGRRASLPPRAWEPPERLVVTPEACTVLFIEENGCRSKVFDFTPLPLPAQLRVWMAGRFADVTGPRGGAKRLDSASDYFKTLTKLAAVLSSTEPVPRAPQEITPAHIAAFRLALTPASHNHKIITLRVLTRRDQELPPETRQAIREGRLPRRSPANIAAYHDDELRQILVAARADIRQARDRIRAGRLLLARYRRGELAPGSHDDRVGEALDLFDRTGDFPRFPGGGMRPLVKQLGGVGALGPMLCLTLAEAVAFALLLVHMTAENYGTVTDWPATHFRPDGGLADPSVALLEEVKPRRGPSREHMVTAVEDLPAGLAEVLDAGAVQERRLFRSPLLVYLLLLDLGSLGRRHAGADCAFCYVGTGRSRRWGWDLKSSYVGDWAELRGFPRPPALGRHQRTPDNPASEESALTASDGRPYVLVQRLRQTAIERRRHPVAQSRSTMNDHYLRRSPRVVQESGEIVREALAREVAKARQAQTVPVFATDFLDRADSDPEAAAAEMGVGVDVLKRIVTREQDTVLASCVDHHDSPHTQPGSPCDASFLACLSCRNARALPHHLPVQVSVHDRLAALRANLPPQIWDHRYGQPFARLSDLLGHYGPEERDDARERLSVADRLLVDDLMNGGLDLR